MYFSVKSAILMALSKLVITTLIVLIVMKINRVYFHIANMKT